MDRQKLQRLSVITASSVAAVLFALLICGIILLSTGRSAIDVYRTMWDSALTRRVQYDGLDRSAPLMLAGCAVALGFKMNLFNIGVEGQYRLAALLAAVIGTRLGFLPAPLHVFTELLIACIGGAAWASIVAILKVKRGVNEVISSIMLNAIAIDIAAWLFNTYFRFNQPGSQNITTKPIPRSGWMPDIVKDQLNGFFIIALLVVAAFWVVVFKSRFGFRLRASGQNDVAARTSGISAKRMIITAMLLSGGVAGLIGMQQTLGNAHSYSSQGFVDQIGFLGIAVALLGRNHPIGIVLSAVLFGLLAASAGKLQLIHVPQEIVQIILGVIVLTVVIVNQTTGRWIDKRIQQQASRAVEHDPATTGAVAA